MQNAEAVAYHHHYSGLETLRTQAFANFRQSYPGFPSIFSNCLVYACPAGQHISNAAEANNLIRQLGLPLRACPTTFSAQNAFTIQFVDEAE